MNNVTGRKRKSARITALTVAAGIFAATLTGGIIAFAFKTQTDGITDAVNADNANRYDNAYGNVVEYTYGKTYTVDGKTKYTLGGEENTGMDYNTALGLGDDCEVTLKNFTYADGTDGTAETDSVRNAGTYELNVQSADDTQYSATVRVGQAPIDFSTVDKIPVFVNANSPRYKAHGDITSIYKHNDGWYPSQKSNEVPVEIRTITNAYYYETNHTDRSNEIEIKMAFESLTNGAKSDVSTLVYDGIELNIKDRSGTAFTTPNEYIATFTFYLTDAQKNNYYFDYGNATEDDEIKDSNKGLSITQRTEDSFVLSKHWFIVKYANLFVAEDDSANYPYVPFHDNDKIEAAGGVTNITNGTTEGSNGETNTATDTVKYTDALTVKTPVSKFNGDDVGSIKFDVTYVDLDGKKHRIATQVTLGATNSSTTKTLTYYFNESMPAGHYTLNLYGELGQDKIIGEYWLTVLPKEIDASLVNDFQTAIQGNNSDGDGKYNSFLLDNKKIHNSVDDEVDALNDSLNDTLGGLAGKSYWSDLSDAAKVQYFDSAVTVMYNRNTWSSSNYVTEEDMIGMLSTYGTYTLYYSIAAKNYVTVGGADDVNRTQYGFRTMLYTGVKVSDIYGSIVNNSDPYFKAVAFNGGDAKTSVPQSSYYTESFNDGEYVNVGRHTVTLTLRDDHTSWDTALPAGVVFDDYFKLGGVNNRSLTVYYNVVPADNGWNVMPQMSSWSFNGFDKSVNAITAGLKFNSTVKYALIPTTATIPENWGVENGNGEMIGGAKDGIVFFTVDESGMVDDTTAALLNSLKPANYYLKFFVNEVTVTVNEGETSKEIVNVKAYNDIARNSAGNPLATVNVSKATNTWTSTPNVVRWTFGEYDSKVNIITAEALYPTLLPKDADGNDITGFTYTNGGAALPAVQFVVYDGSTVVTDLSKLHAGTYTLATSMGGSDYYTEIAETRMSFTVGIAVNTWTTAPRVIGWTYGSFDSSYFIAGVPRFNESTDGQGNPAKVEYTLTKNGDGEFAPLTFTEFSENDFKKLGAGSYTLNVFYAGTGDYGKLDNDVFFTVAPYVNGWNPSPSLRGWSYKNFTSGLFTAGVPVRQDNETATVSYEVTGGKLTGGVTLTVNADGTLTQTSVDFLTDLAAGSYKLKATYAGTVNYDAINASIDFEVTKIVNSWATSPSVIGWIYGSFDESYFTAGVPRFNESKDGQGNPAKVQYTLTKTDDDKFTPVTYTAFTKDDFNNLNAGAYRIDVYYTYSDNYDELTAVITFTVGKCVNTWSTTPSLRGWDYKNFTPSLFSAGIPTLDKSVDNEGNPAAVTYELTGGNLEKNVMLTVSADGTLSETSGKFLTALSVGGYTLFVTYPKTNNYDPLTQTITFNVSQISNSWSTKPRVIGWTYGSFDSSYFIAGVPTLAEDETAEVTYTLTKNGDDKFTPVTFTEFSEDDFKNLDKGVYTLRIVFDGTVNYKGLDDEITFIVGEYTNGWNPSPSLRGWGYKNFTSGLFTAGVPVRQDDETAAVSYEVTGGKLTGGVTLTVNADGTLTQTSVDFLTALGAGSYTLKATYAGTDNYKAISASIEFDVIRITNSWATRPSLLGWPYKAFSEEYFTAGVPTFNESIENGVAAQVKYRLVKNGDGTFTAVTFTTLEEVDLSALTVGSYTLYASYAGTDDYEELKAEDTVITFNVSKTGNNWLNGVSPDVSGWTYKAFAASLFTDGEAEHGTVTYTVVGSDGKTAKIGEESLGGLPYATLKSKLNNLGAGNYTLQATSGSTEDYSAIEWSKQFAVAKADNEWGTYPSIDGWVYGEAHAAPDNGAAKYENAVITGKYHLTADDGVGNPIDTIDVAGDYAYVLTVGDTANYNGFTTTLFFTVEKAANGWKTKPAATVTWTYRSESNAEIVFEPEYNKNLMEITLGGTAVSASELMDKLGALGVGSYSIVASVPANEIYAALEPVTITLVIEQAADSFGEFNVPAGWEWDDVSQKTDENGVAWQTNWNTALKVPVPAVSTTATAIVYRGAAEEVAVTLHYETVGGVKQVLTTDLNALKTKLLGLHVYDNYRIDFVVADSANHKGCTVSGNFAVTKADNNWDGADGLPHIAGWQYESSVANPTATPMYGKGTVKFSYAKVVGDETADDIKANKVTLTWQDGTDTAGGSYWLRAEVPGTDDYNYLVGYCKFSISAGKNDWVNNAGVIAWNWNGYNRTVNLFSGSAKNNGLATFRISAVTSSNGTRGLLASDFVFNGETVNITNSAVATLFSDNGFTLETVDNVAVVSVEVAKYLNALKPGTYSLSVTIAADNNYDELKGSATFVVGKAANSWATGKAPAVSSYIYRGYNETTSFTYGETVYGDKSAVRYRLEGTTYGEEVIDLGKDGTAGYVQVQTWLKTLGAGNYTLSAWVAESENGTYSALYSFGSPYTTRSFTVSRATNGWTNETLVTQISKPYSEIRNKSFTQTEFAKLYAQLTPVDGTVNYALLNADYTSLGADELTYAGLFEKIKALPSGEYVIRATAAQTDNYTSISPADTRLTISTHGNSFTAIPDSLTAQWARGVDENNETVNKTVLTDFTVTAQYGTGTVTYTLDKTAYDNYTDFKAAVSTLNAGSYNVTIAINGTDEYAGLSEVRMLTVSPSVNSWKDGWSVGGSLSVADASAGAGSWGWKSTVSWTKAVPLYGTTVYVEIRKAGASSALQYITIDYGADNGDSAVKTISEAISALDVGNYELIVSAPATVNWNALSNKTSFSISKVENGWKTAPYITGAADNKWEYGDTVIPAAEAKYGTVRYEYETSTGTKLTSMPTTSGEYVIKFIVDDSTNYGGVSGALSVTIEKTTNRDFSVALGVIGWTWGSYDRAINVFRGTPEITELENASVKFSVGTGTGENFVALPDLEEFTLNAFGLVEKDSNAEAALRALTGGTGAGENNTTTYTLRIHVSGTANYNAFVYDNTFAVTGATNTWTKSPTIVPWIVNNWTDESLPGAVALYGAPEITVTGEADGTVYFKGAYVKNEDGELELVPEINILNLAPEGYYVMTTSVKEEIGHYNSPLSESYRFRINVKGAGEANYWEELPGINGWVANVEELYNLPAGKPIRGLPNFVFYVRNTDGTRGQKVDASLSDLVLKKGDKYEADIYIPLEPGDYILVASSKGNPTEEGKSDALAEYEIRVIIDPRPISFKEEPRISTLLYLGDRNNWADPTSKATLDDAEYDYVYTNKETGETSREMPTKAGRYTVTATISAKYANSVTMSVDFTVELSPNSWVSAPNVKDWSEEFPPNDPFGEASFFSDQIKYTYASVDEPDKILTEIPTEEGSYIMYADLDVEGYEPLHAEYRFTIEPAFDTDLLIVDVILGLIACALTVVTINLIVKKTRKISRR